MKTDLPLLDEFEWLSAAVIDETASAEDRTRFNALLRGHPELAQVYFEQVAMHAWLTSRKESGDAAGDHAGFRAPVPAARGRTAPRNARRFPRRVRMGSLAAAALLAVGAGLALLVARAPSPQTPRPVLPPVSVLCHDGSAGLDLPRTLPGTVRLRGGMARVGLPSGVELILSGPLELTLETADGREARLERGSLIAWVPPRANGLILRTAQIEAWDIGTVFAVSADAAAGSRVFVFQGAVQVNDSDGCGAGLCEAGEGILAPPGGAVIKIASDWPEAQRLFRRAAGHAAIRNPADALDAAKRIGDEWRVRYEPEEAWRIRERRTREAVQPQRTQHIPFRKTAWVRPSVNVAKQEEKTMTNRIGAAVLAAAAVTMGAERAAALSAPTRIDTSWGEDRRWTTIHTNEVPLAWEWPESATHAELRVTGMNRQFTTNFQEAVSGCVWQAFASVRPDSEEVYELTLTFTDGEENPVETLRARLAVLSGAFGQTVVDASQNERLWTQVRENRVLPYDAGWAQATAGAPESQLVIRKLHGPAQTNRLQQASGYYGWKVQGSGFGYGVYELSLTFPGTEGNWDAVLEYVPQGTLISLR
ncbi:MAG: hypothetical protein RBT78_04530 [Kiritimatiellia bacterium]|jgi:hypothetical protein|nr:hypothetical protein [Kiritimatiellia bacterium]